MHLNILFLSVLILYWHLHFVTNLLRLIIVTTYVYSMSHLNTTVFSYIVSLKISHQQIKV